jgi:uncharacterized protein (TIGR02145 family)
MKNLNLILIIILAFIFVKCTVENNNITVEGCEKSSNICEVMIGNQIWMCKNLNVDHYRNGDPIPEVRDNDTWIHITTGAWCYYDNNSANGVIYGKLYNWYAVNDPRGLAPEGWHIPSGAEWTVLENYLGGWDAAGGKMKETGTVHWNSPNIGATNSSGFSALPGGWRYYYYGTFINIGHDCNWWSATEYNTLCAYSSGLLYNYTHMYNGGYCSKVHGFSVRCVKDN